MHQFADSLIRLAASAERSTVAHSADDLETARSVAFEAGLREATQAARARKRELAAVPRPSAPGFDASRPPTFPGTAADRQRSDVASLHSVLASGRFNLAFQPIVDLADGAVHHYEALLRPPEDLPGKLKRPEDFVRCAEAVGMSDALDLAVSERVIQALAFSPVSIALNLSGLSIQSSGFRHRLIGMLDAAPAVLPRLLVEITETAEIDDEAEAERMLAALHDRGVKVCIDDLGASVATFRYLRSFRVDWMKIDGAFIANATRSKRNQAFIRSVMSLSDLVGAKVIAERIESAADAALMRSLGVHCGQGWHCGRPAPLPRALVARHGTLQENWTRSHIL